MGRHKKERHRGRPCSIVNPAKKMKICTINLPTLYLNLIKVLLDEEGGLYPSRCELVRVALGEFLERKIGVQSKMKHIVNSYLKENGIKIKILREA